jgi:SET domain-containing protein
MARKREFRIREDDSPYRLGVKASKIDRVGVFAGKAIPQGHKVLTYAGEKLSCEDAAVRFWVALKRNPKARTFMARLNRLWIIDGAVGGNGAERINHCCDPNVYFRRAYGRIFIYSRRRIRKGEELTLDYRFPEDRVAIPCHCGSPKCRGYMNRRLILRKIPFTGETILTKDRRKVRFVSLGRLRRQGCASR